ncbi:ERAD-associated E3 ubiquitin-protein ligase doa10 [Diplonema papillatum]|nr:ERAD-associated E3 ubiquitin-protein ligase doa10 [Diplonema papillatum]
MEYRGHSADRTLKNCSDDDSVLTSDRDDSPKWQSDEDPPECRICRTGEGVLISPCSCKGTCKWVHEECLIKWLKRSEVAARNAAAGAARKYECEICHAALDVTVKVVTDGWNFFKERYTSPALPSLLVLYISAFAPSFFYIFCVLLDTVVLRSLQLFFPSIVPGQLAPVIGGFALVLLKLTLIVSPLLPSRVRSFVTRHVNHPIERTVLAYAWTSPSISVVISLGFSFFSFTLPFPGNVSPWAAVSKNLSILLNIIAVGLLITAAFFTGTHTLAGVNGMRLEQPHSKLA